MSLFFLLNMMKSTTLVAARIAATKTSNPASGPAPKTIGIGPMNITTPVLAELGLEPNMMLARTIAAPVNSRINPAARRRVSQIGEFDSSVPPSLIIPSSGVVLLHLQRK